MDNPYVVIQSLYTTLGKQVALLDKSQYDLTLANAQVKALQESLKKSQDKLKELKDGRSGSDSKGS